MRIARADRLTRAFVPLPPEGKASVVDASNDAHTETDPVPRSAFDQAFAAAYPALARIARSAMRREQSGHTLQATSLVSEAYLRLLRDAPPQWSDEGHLLGVAARSMRQVLIEHARARGADKRGSNAVHLTLSAARDVAVDGAPSFDDEALHQAIVALEHGNPRQAAVVQLRYFGGLSIDETAEVLDLSPATVKREWALARLWLLRSLRTDET